LEIASNSLAQVPPPAGFEPALLEPLDRLAKRPTTCSKSSLQFGPQRRQQFKRPVAHAVTTRIIFLCPALSRTWMVDLTQPWSRFSLPSLGLPWSISLSESSAC